MSLQEIKHIEGLENEFEDIEAINDINPGATLVKFYVKSVDMPFLSKHAGHIVRDNRIYFHAIINLGNLIIDEPIKDNVYFNDGDGKWKVKMLAKGEESYIKKYPNEWNAFVRGSADTILGTPLSFLFKNDLAKCDAYKGKHIHTIEQLEACTDVHFQELGFGSRADQEKAHRYMENIRLQAPAVELNNRFEEKDIEIRNLKKQLGEITEKLTEVLSAKLSNIKGDDNESKKPKGRPSRKPKETTVEGI